MNTAFFKRSQWKSFFGDRHFYCTALAVMIPVTLQQMITALFNLVDNIMVSHIDALTMSAVTVANKPYMIYIGVFFGFTGAASLLLSQYFGAKKLEVCQRIFSVEMLLGLSFSLVYAVLLLAFPGGIMRIFVTDPYTIEVGVTYLRVIAYSYLPAAFSMVCIFSMRALGFNVLPMVVSMLTIASNAFFNWIFIFGRLGAPRLGAEGAALGTLLARMIEAMIYVYVLLRRKTAYSLRLGEAFKIGRPLMADYVRRAIPLTVNELLWSGGLIIFFWTYARISEPSIPALNVADQIMNVAWVLFHGISAAVSVMVGKCLGAGDFAGAKGNAKKLLMLGLMVSLLCVAVSLSGSTMIQGVFTSLDGQQLTLARQLIYILSVFFPTSAMYNICFFLLRAGGDTRSAMKVDSGYMWVVVVPVALFMALFLPGKIDVRLAFGIVQTLMNLKIIFALHLVRKGHWLRNLTYDG